MKSPFSAAARCIAHCWHLLAPEFLAYVAPDPRMMRKPTATSELIRKVHSAFKRTGLGK